MRNSIHNVRKYFGHAMIVVVALFMALAAFPQTAQTAEIYIPAVMTGTSGSTQSERSMKLRPLIQLRTVIWIRRRRSSDVCRDRRLRLCL